MATYDLDQTALIDLLANNYAGLPSVVTGAVPLPIRTEISLLDALVNAGLYPKPGQELNTTYQVDNNASVNIDLSTIYAGKPAGFFLELGSGDTINVTGSAGAVVATGEGSNKIQDFANSDDTLVGGAGHDTLIGGGASHLIAGSGTDALYGQNLGDTTASDTLQGGLGDDTLHVYSGNNLIIGGGNQDTIVTGIGDDTIYGMSGHDSITTSLGGHTTIYAGSGQETIDARNGQDTIYVGYSTNYSLGAGGSDTIDAGGQSNTSIHINAIYNANLSSPKTLANGDKLIIFSNGSVTTNVEISGHATLVYLDHQVKI